MASAPECRHVLGAPAVLVPVPLHPRRLRERGFNQSELLAHALGRRSGLVVAPDALVRRKETPPQTGLTASARRSNVSGAFAVRRRSQVAGRVVVLVDDVVTTGATARACAAALRAAGTTEVRLVTAARVN
jgi:ComF family protein